MFKHYLSYQLVLSFEQSCRGLELAPQSSSELLASCRKTVVHFATAIQTTDAKERLKNLCVALLCLRDCREVLDREDVKAFDVRGRYEVIHSRLENLCLEASDAEGGQLQLIG